MTSISFYPAFSDRLTLISNLYRAVWALLPAADHIDKLSLPYEGADNALVDVDQLTSFGQAFLPKDFDPAIADLAPIYSDILSLDAEPEPDVIVLWDASDAADVSQVEEMAGRVGARVVVSDPVLSERDLLDLMLLAYEIEPEHLGLRRTGDHFARFVQWSRQTKGEPAHLFATGPSIRGLLEASAPPKGLRIACNALISDINALQALNPSVLVAGDPVQHCGPSRTAAEFRAGLQKALSGSDRVAIVPLGFVPYLESVLPEDLHQQIIGIPTAAVPGFNIDVAAQFATATTANVMTMLMLPIALTVSNQVMLYGCDGKANVSDNKAWSHKDEADYQEAMDSSKRLHPAFWAKDFTAEYQAYCADLESIIRLAEQNGATVLSGTPSYVPALKARFNT